MEFTTVPIVVVANKIGVCIYPHDGESGSIQSTLLEPRKKYFAAKNWGALCGDNLCLLNNYTRAEQEPEEDDD